MNRYLLTPYFLDQERPSITAAFPPEWAHNQPYLPKGKTQKRLAPLHRAIAEFTAAAVNRGDRPISVAGDGCATIGMLAGLQHAGIDPTLLWLDAHGAFNTWRTSPSGYLVGMPLAMIVGRGEQTMVNNVALTPLPEAQVVLSDGRDLDPGELAGLKKSAVRHVVQFKDLLHWNWGDRPIYVHFDTDLLDPLDMPATLFPSRGGPRPNRVKQLFELLNSTGLVAAVSMTAWDTDKDDGGVSAEIVLDLFNTLVKE